MVCKKNTQEIGMYYDVGKFKIRVCITRTVTYLWVERLQIPKREALIAFEPLNVSAPFDNFAKDVQRIFIGCY